MLLKIKDDRGWWMYDGYPKIHWGDSGSGDAKVDAKNEIVFRGNKCQPHLLVLCDLNEERDVCWALCRDKSNEEFLFVFDEGYVLNDEGKTIERIR